MRVSAPALTVEVLHFPKDTARASATLRGFTLTRRHEPVHCVATTHYHGAAEWLMLWGPGAPERAAIMARHVARGGHVVAVDLAYWHRDTKARIAIDAAHPSAWVMRQSWPPSRLEADGLTLADRWDPDGPIILAGLGAKARAQYGAAVIDQWEAAKYAACRARWPERSIRYRRKRPTDPLPAWATSSSPHVIDAVLTGASLLVTWHSNVAIDAIRLGIPVVCQDGAASAVCPAEVPTDPQPLARELRRQFLANLAWFQWAPTEARHLWRFVAELLCAS
jgi:hypothetical protein